MKVLTHSHQYFIFSLFLAISHNIQGQNRNFLSDNFENSHNCQTHLANKTLTDKRAADCLSPELELYLKRPPVVSSFLITEQANQTIELYLKDDFSFTELEIEYRQEIGVPNGISDFETDTLQMFDDGTNGDRVVGDKIFSNNNFRLNYMPTSTYRPKFVSLNISYKDNGTTVHSDAMTLDFISANQDFLDNLDIPLTYGFDNKDYIFNENFIYYNKYNNWEELTCNQFGGDFDLDYIIGSKSLLYDYWGDQVINSPNDKNLYMQIDFGSPAGQFLFGQDIALTLNSLSGVQIHEILHLWIPTIHSYLGIDFEDSNQGHQPNIFKNTSGFLYSSWSRSNGIFCENQLDNFQEDEKGKYLRLDYDNGDFELCGGDIEAKDKILFNDYELYLMGLVPIEEVSLPLKRLSNILEREEVINDATGLLVAEKVYYENYIEITEEELVAAKQQMLNDAANQSLLLASEPNNFFFTFSGNKSDLSQDEIKILQVLSDDFTVTGEKIVDYNSDFKDPSFFEATGGRGSVTANIPMPMEYTGKFFTTEYVDIEEGDSYKGWTESGEYTEIFESNQYQDSTVTTKLTVKRFQLPTNNFAVKAIGTSCTGNTDGSINIIANQDLGYMASLTNSSQVSSTMSFNKELSFEALEPGKYQVCITIEGKSSFEQCFELKVTEPEPLGVSSKINRQDKTVTFQLTGSSRYLISINGNSYQTQEKQLTLPLSSVINEIKILADRGCQGSYEETVLLQEAAFAYPNPVVNEKLTVLLGSNLHNTFLDQAIYDLNGKLVLLTKGKSDLGTVTINTETLSKGVYIIDISSSGKKLFNQKIIKE